MRHSDAGQGTRRTRSGDEGDVPATHAAVVSRLEQEMDDERRLPLAWYVVLLELNTALGLRVRMQDLGNRVVLP